MSPARFRLFRPGLASFSFVLATVNLCAEIEWRGTIIRNGTPTFALNDTVSGESKWVPMGAAFETFEVSTYDAQRQLLVLTKAGVRTELTLASSHVVAAAKPASDNLKNLAGLALADALANRGDAGLRDQLSQLRTEQLNRDELSRRLAEAERLAQNAPASASRRGPPSQGKANTPTPESARDDLRNEAQRADEEIARLTAQIEKTAIERRAALSGDH